MSDLPENKLNELQNHLSKTTFKILRKGNARRQARKEIARVVRSNVKLLLFPIILWIYFGVTDGVLNFKSTKGIYETSVFISVIFLFISGIILIGSIFVAKAEKQGVEQGYALDVNSADCGIVDLKVYVAERVRAGISALIFGLIALPPAVACCVAVNSLYSKVNFSKTVIIACIALVLSGISFGFIRIGGCLLRSKGWCTTKGHMLHYACPKCKMINTTIIDGNPSSGMLKTREWKSQHVRGRYYTPTANVYDNNGSKVGTISGPTRYSPAYDVYEIHDYREVTTSYKCLWCGHTHSETKEKTVSSRTEAR